MVTIMKVNFKTTKETESESMSDPMVIIMKGNLKIIYLMVRESTIGPPESFSKENLLMVKWEKEKWTFKTE